MKKLTVLLCVLLFGVSVFSSYGQEVKQKEAKSGKEATISKEERRTAKKISKDSGPQKKKANKGNAYGISKEAEGKESGKDRSAAATKVTENGSSNLV